jgi:formate C-acetyltransferase
MSAAIEAEPAVAVDPWRGFAGQAWREAVDVRAFIQENYAPYEGDDGFLAEATDRTASVRDRCERLLKAEHERGGVLEIDTKRVSSLLTFPPGYIDRENEIVVGLQTDRPLKRAVNPFGGIRMARAACAAYGYHFDPALDRMFSDYKTTHNDGVFRVYDEEMRAVRKSGVITGLPDAYGRGRLIGDYRRVALYGIDALIHAKQADKEALSGQEWTDDRIRLAEEIYRQLDFLRKLKEMAALYGFDISGPARNGREATQWLYFAYLGAIKEQNGAAMSLGRVSTFLDIYFSRDLAEGTLDEAGVQEIVDDFVLKLRMSRQLRTPDYNALFAGDPTWVTECIGGMGEDGRTMVTRSSYRFLHTLRNLGPAPEPNLTVLWSTRLPGPFKEYCAAISIDTDSIQYENDDLMRPRYGDDYGIACCVSAMRIGQQMQYFGARCNLPKALLMALNGGRDEISGEQIAPASEPIGDGPLDPHEVEERLWKTLDWLAQVYVNQLNIIHYMHDKYAYEKLQMALHDTEVERCMAFGVAGLSVVADSLSAIRHATVTPVRDENGLITSFEIEGDYPAFGNDDDRVDAIAVDLVEGFIDRLRAHPIHRGATPTLSVLTITSNVVYGTKTGETPDGRRRGEAFAPGANPMHGRDTKGALASLNSVAKLPFDACRDGISNTFTVTPTSLGRSRGDQVANLADLLDGYVVQDGHHLNVNVLDRGKLEDAMAHPEKYPQLTIRVSGYAVHFHRLTRQQQEEVISRTFHEAL